MQGIKSSSSATHPHLQCRPNLEPSHPAGQTSTYCARARLSNLLVKHQPPSCLDLRGTKGGRAYCSPTWWRCPYSPQLAQHIHEKHRGQQSRTHHTDVASSLSKQHHTNIPTQPLQTAIYPKAIPTSPVLCNPVLVHRHGGGKDCATCPAASHSHHCPRCMHGHLF